MLFDILLQFDERFKKGFHPNTPIRLKPKELDLVSLIAKDPGHSMQFYAERVHLEPGSFTYLASVLEDKNLIQRIDNEENRRKKTLILTKQGNELTGCIFKQMENYVCRVMSNFKEEEQVRLQEAIKTFNELIDKLPTIRRKH